MCQTDPGVHVEPMASIRLWDRSRGSAAGLTAWTEAKPISGLAADAPPDSSDWNEFWAPTGGIQQATQGLPRCPRLQNLVRRGVPPDQRAALWRLCAAPGHPGHYDALLEQQQVRPPPRSPHTPARLSPSPARHTCRLSDLGCSQAEGASTASRQIDKDLHRTFGGVPEVRVPQQEALASLRNVLTACASRARPAPPRSAPPRPAPPRPALLVSKPPHRPAALRRACQTRPTTPRSATVSR